ncbi:MAG: sialate O-acetylesterase [Colwellia sp.]
MSHSAYSQVDEKFHIYLAFGQSNMEGQGELNPEDKLVNERIKVLQNFTCPNLNRSYGQWYIAEPPLFGCWGKLGVADYFARTMIENSAKDITIGIVPTAVGGSDIALFQKSAPIGKGKAGPEKVPANFKGGYAWLLDLAKKAQKVGVIKGIIFHQGETNTSDPKWKYKVLEVVNDLRADLQLGDVPFLSGELLYKTQNGCCGSHNTEIAQLPSIITNAHVVSAKGLDAVDVAHFTAASYREFGRRYATIMLPLVK